MSANNRKIDVNDDPEKDPKLAAILGTQPKKARLQNLLSQVAQSTNPIAEPDRPLPPAEELRRAALEMSQPKANLPEFLARAETVSGDFAASGVPSAVTEPKVDSLVPSVSEPPRNLEPTISTEGAAVIRDEVSVSLKGPEEQPSSRGRPRMGDVRKTETSYSLSPETVKRIRDLAAYNQIRLGRSVSGSEIAEYLLMQAFKTIVDNEVLPH